MKLEIIKKIVGVIMLICSIPFGVLIMAYSLLISTLISTFINAYPNRKLMNYTYVEQLRDMLPSMILAVIMCIIIFPIKYIIHNSFLLMITQIICGGMVYIGGAALLKMDSFYDILKITKSFIHH